MCNLNHSTQLPLVSQEIVILDNDDIIHFKVALKYVPFLSRGYIRQILLFPTTPELFYKILNAGFSCSGSVVAALSEGSTR